jgi:curved DNA-binding protein CbpA
VTAGRPDRSTDLYRLLQVDPEADTEIIGAAYRKLAQRYHPDLTDDPDAAARMTTINAAWEVLRDPAKRALYDRERRFATGGGAGHGAAAATGMPADPGARRGAGERASGSADRSADPAAWGGRTPGGPSGASASTRDGEKWRAGGAAGTGGAHDDWAGPPPGIPSGSVITFGRYRGWSLGQIARHDLSFLEWLERAPTGRQYQAEIATLLRRYGRR